MEPHSPAKGSGATEDAAPEVKALLTRFFALAPREQFAAYEAIREFLSAAAPETALDRELRERAESLEAFGRIASHLGLPEGKAPTANQFNENAPEFAPGWDSSRVTRLWGRWRFATDTYRGRGLRWTAHQTELVRRAERRRGYSEAECVNFLRRWLETDPKIITIKQYDRWHVEVNDRLDADERPLPWWQAISSRLELGFAEALAVARGEIELAEAQRLHAERVSAEKQDWTRTEHLLVGIEWIVAYSGMSRAKVITDTHRLDFPPPAVEFPGRRAWLSGDIEAYYRGEPLPEREPRELQHLYVSSGEMANTFGWHIGAILKNRASLPKPAGRVSGRHFYLRGEVEQWARDNPHRLGRKRRRDG